MIFIKLIKNMNEKIKINYIKKKNNIKLLKLQAQFGKGVHLK